jgi:GLPGLI family protein
MKKLILMWTVLVALVSTKMVGQDFQGKAEYFSKYIFKEDNTVGDNIDESIKGKAFDDALKVAMKKSSEKTFTLVFNRQEAVYEENEELKQPVAPSGGFSISVSMSGGGKKYINTKERISLEEDEIFGKEFLIEEPLVQPNWKLLEETKKIGEYNCAKAELIVPVSEEEKEAYQQFLKKEAIKPALFKMEEPKDKLVTAWYAPEIPVGFGPNNYWGLPGLILEINEENSVILCSKIVLNSKDKVKIKRPKSGIKVSKLEFIAIEVKKMDSMKDDNGVIIQKFEK